MEQILKKVKLQIKALGYCELYEADFFMLDMTSILLDLKKQYHVQLINAKEARGLEKSGWHYVVKPINIYLLSLGFTKDQIVVGVEDWQILEKERELKLRPWEE